jgi:beta-RFAP synthase
MTIESPARLHFGLIEIADGEPNQFGGVGLTLAFPRTVLTVRTSDYWSIENHSARQGLEAEDTARRIEQVARRWIQSLPMNLSDGSLPNVSISVDQASPMHTGFGSGTQLAAATATLLKAFVEFDPPEIDSRRLSNANEVWRPTSLPANLSKITAALAQICGRGKRSYIGMAGFLAGGWIFDDGIPLSHHSLPPRKTEVPATSLPSSPAPRRLESLRADAEIEVVVATAIDQTTPTVAGPKELQLFEALAKRPNTNRQRMSDLIRDRIRPAIEQMAVGPVSDWKRFAEALFEYGELAGEVFRSVQYGQYATKTITNQIMTLRQHGFLAAGQSSWGPGIFCVCQNADEANAVERLIADHPQFSTSQCLRTKPQNHSATLASANDLSRD